MKFSKASAVALMLQAASARFVLDEEKDNVVLYPNEAEEQKYLIELAPGKTQWVTEDEKWELRRVSC
jgi:leucyl aminopeptidase